MNTGNKNVQSGKPLRLWPLLGLNFFMADMQSGIGPFVGVFLQAHGWASGLIRTAMTLGDVVGMLITTPIGGFTDATNYKRSWVIVPGVGVVLASVIILFSQDFGLLLRRKSRHLSPMRRLFPPSPALRLALSNERASTSRTEGRGDRWPDNSIPVKAASSS